MDKTDHMPRKICENCFKILLTFHDLYELSLQTKERLESIFAYPDEEATSIEQINEKSKECNESVELNDYVKNEGNIDEENQEEEDDEAVCES